MVPTCGLSWFLLIACLLGPLLGYVGSYLRVICIEWRVADRLCRDGAYIESNSFDSLGLSFQRAPSEYATLVERMLSRPNRVTIRHRADAQLIGQVPAFRALKKFSIYDVDPSEFALSDVTRSPGLEEVHIHYSKHEDLDISTLRLLPNLSTLQLSGIRTKSEFLVSLAQLRQLDQLFLHNMTLSEPTLRRLQHSLPETVITVVDRVPTP